MTTRTANDILKGRVGDLMFEIATVQSENEALKAKLLDVARMIPPAELEKMKLKILGTEGNGEDPMPPPPPPPLTAAPVGTHPAGEEHVFPAPTDPKD